MSLISYKNLYSSGHDENIDMKTLDSIIEKGFRYSFFFEHHFTWYSKKSILKKIKCKIPYSTFGICEKVIFFYFY